MLLIDKKHAEDLASKLSTKLRDTNLFIEASKKFVEETEDIALSKKSFLGTSKMNKLLMQGLKGVNLASLSSSDASNAVSKAVKYIFPEVNRTYPGTVISSYSLLSIMVNYQSIWNSAGYSPSTKIVTLSFDDEHGNSIVVNMALVIAPNTDGNTCLYSGKRLENIIDDVRVINSLVSKLNLIRDLHTVRNYKSNVELSERELLAIKGIEKIIYEPK